MPPMDTTLYILYPLVRVSRVVLPPCTQCVCLRPLDQACLRGFHRGSVTADSIKVFAHASPMPLCVCALITSVGRGLILFLTSVIQKCRHASPCSLHAVVRYRAYRGPIRVCRHVELLMRSRTFTVCVDYIHPTAFSYSMSL